MRKGVLLILFLITNVFVFSQQTKEFVLYGVVKDEISKEPIPNVKVLCQGNKIYTNRKGEFALSIVFETELVVKFKHVGFKSYEQTLTSKMAKRKVVGDTMYWNIILKNIVLEGAVITVNKVDTVFGSLQYSVEDYIFLSDDNLLLLAYEKTFKKQAKLLLTDRNQKIIATYTVPFPSLYLYDDYAGHDYVVCENKVYQINIRNQQINLLPVLKEDFYGFYQRVIDTIGDNYYYSNYNDLYPAVKFYVTERNDTAHHELYEVKDDFMMELYRAQYKYVSGRDKLWAYRKEQETGIDKEIWIGASSFTQDILYKPVYAPLFVINDTVLLFDQYKNKLIKFDEYSDNVGDCFMNYNCAPKGEKWEQPILEDKSRELIYAIYNGGGYTYVKQLNYGTGKIGVTTKLKFRFIENIKIDNGYVYYIYRPFESSQKRFIYKEKLAK